MLTPQKTTTEIQCSLLRSHFSCLLFGLVLLIVEPVNMGDNRSSEINEKREDLKESSDSGNIVVIDIQSYVELKKLLSDSGEEFSLDYNDLETSDCETDDADDVNAYDGNVSEPPSTPRPNLPVVLA